ncbi:MAG: folate-binding protein YgfZ [Planctomycetia bacterium]|nr:MAG: folate-binding protein YgfZ [Planctomycetia bacterium]
MSNSRTTAKAGAAGGPRPAETTLLSGQAVPAHFGDPHAEAGAARVDATMFDRSDRALLRVEGADRQAWLHNLLTNDIKRLTPGQGCYAFACDVRGRVQFDLNVLCDSDALVLDSAADRRELLHKWLDRYLLSERATIATEDSLGRIGLSGPRAVEIVRAIAGEAAAALAEFGHCELSGASAGERLVRHDFAGSVGFELLVRDIGAWWERLAREHGVRPAGLIALDALRIEAGIPWYGREIDERTVAPESGQIGRAIVYDKGCYLGQEIVERMRSFGNPARRLARMRVQGDADCDIPAPLTLNGTECGRLTSLSALGDGATRAGLGFVRFAIAPGALLVLGESGREVQLL